jgi:CRP/FNR family transcriptional regulator
MSKRNYRDLIKGRDPVLPEDGIFRHLTAMERASLLHGVTVMKFLRHDIMIRQFMPADHIIYVTGGLVKTFRRGRSGRIVCISLAGPGQFVALPCALGPGEYRFSASAVESTDALMIRTGSITKIINENGSFSREITTSLSNEMIEVSEKLVSLSVKQLPGRVADLIRYFSEEVFRSDDFTVPLTRQELAELIGTTKESLIRTLNEFRNDKLIEMEGRRIKIIAPDLIDILCELG